MKYKTFKKIIELQIAHHNKIEAAYKLNIDLLEAFIEHETVISMLWDEILTDFGVDWLNWYLYEKNGISGYLKKKFTAHDGKVEICKNLKGLHEYLIKQKYFKNTK